MPSFPRHRQLPLAALLAALTACAPQLDAQKAAPAAAADTLRFPAPDRPVSRIVAPRWTGEEDRDQMGEAASVIALAGVRAGMTVADIGAGDGYYVARLSTVVGPTGTVFGEDVIPDYLALLERRIKSERLTNARAVLGTADDPKLPARAVDVAFMIHMYHEITRPFELLWNLSRAMKPGGTLAILDQDGPTDQHGTPPALLACELKALGFEPGKRTVLADGAYVVLFAAPREVVAPAVVRERLAAKACTQR